MMLSFFAFIPAAFRHDPVAAAELAVEDVEIVTDSGSYTFRVEIADNEETRSRGLMFRRQLGEREGMIFFYESEKPITMWMKNTYISLDMVFIHADGLVERVAQDTEPFSEDIIPSDEPVLAVLEVKAGTAATIGLKSGDRVKHQRFKAAGRH